MQSNRRERQTEDVMARSRDRATGLALARADGDA